MNRVIISRKGFDSSFGEVPSPIFPDGSMASIPIPDPKSPVRYGEIASPWRSRSMGDVLHDLSRGLFGHDLRAHLDPDLSPSAITRQPGWTPIFGQSGGQQTHLHDRDVGPGDLFLFFGWFKEVEETAGGLRYRRGAPNLHVLFGWMRVGSLIPLATETAPGWARSHPHLHGRRPTNNTLYVAAKRQGGVPDAGVFASFDESLVLSDRRKRTRKHWRLPTVFEPGCMSHHEDPSRWTREADSVTLESVGRGQEFVVDIERHRGVALWAERLIDERAPRK